MSWDRSGWASVWIKDRDGNHIARYDSPVVPRIGETVLSPGGPWKVTDVEWVFAAEGSPAWRDGKGPSVYLWVVALDGGQE